MNTGLWVLLWVIVALVIIGILLWAANRKPVEKSQESLIDVLARYPHQNPLDYLADIYPVTGEYPKPLTGIQKEAEAKRAIEEFAAGSTAAPEVKFEHKPIPGRLNIYCPPTVELVKAIFEKGKAKHPSVKSKTPVAKKAPAKKAAKPVAKKRVTKKV